MILHSIKKIILHYKQPNMGYVLCNSHLLLCRHNFANSSLELDLQKSEWKYTIEEENKILGVLNRDTIKQLQQYCITNSQIKWIQEHRSKIGSYENLDDLLLVKGMTKSAVRKFYKSIITDGSTEIKKLERTSLSIPVMTNAIREKINTILSLCVGANIITWAQLSRTSTLLNWDSSSFREMPENLHLASLIPFALKMSYSIPNSDIILIKSSQMIIQNNMNFTNYRATMQRHQLTASLLSIIGYREVCSRDNDSNELPEALQHKIFLLKPRVTSRLFNLQIGSEVVSSEKVVHSLFTSSPSTITHPILPVNVSSDLQSNFKQKNAYEREQMSKALLQSLAFLNLCILNNSPSLRINRKRPRLQEEKNEISVN